MGWRVALTADEEEHEAMRRSLPTLALPLWRKERAVSLNRSGAIAHEGRSFAGILTGNASKSVQHV
jgi:hypothetical protein